MAASPALLLLLSLMLCEYGSGLTGHLGRKEGGQWGKAFPLHHGQDTGQNGPRGNQGQTQRTQFRAAQTLRTEAGAVALQRDTQQEQSLFRQVLLEGMGKGREGALSTC